jgi:hypothetical protein
MTNDRIVTGVKTLGGNDPWAQGQSFRTVEQLQAQIASLTAENERLREALHFVLSWAEPIAGDGSNLTEYEIWEELHSIELARAALQPKEGEG